MKLVIHDLNDEQWREIADRYQDSTVISDDGSIRPCVGCFGCWNKDPGRCVVKDGYENMGYLIHHADEVIVISRYTYGGFSGFVKNVFDRCLGYVLPHFELVNDQSHHKRRYDEDKPFTFIFYGHNLSEEDKENAARYVEAVCTNMRSHVKEVIFNEVEDKPEEKTITPKNISDKTILLNASMRSANGNSAKLAIQLQKFLKGESEIINLSKYLNSNDELISILSDAPRIAICTPLYVDGLPSQLIRLMENMENRYNGPAKKIYVLSNMGLYESEQLINLLSAVKKWCSRIGFEYAGALAVAAGELVGGFLEMSTLDKWPLKEINEGMKKLSEAINNNEIIDDLYTGTYSFPRWLYMAIANSGWRRMGKANGLTNKDLFRRL